MMYFVTTINVENDEIKESRCIGYFDTYEEAENIVLNNMFDIHELLYNYALIEAIPSGAYQYDENPHWFIWSISGHFEEINAPEFAKCRVGFGIG